MCHKDAQYLLGAATNYTNPIARSLIWDLKYQQSEAAARALADILAGYIERVEMSLDDYILVPVPLHPRRKRRRGFNQAELIASFLSRATDIPLATNGVQKIQETRPQAEIKEWREREENIQSAFSIIDTETIRGKNIVIIDDVTTSGATLREISRLLKSAGAKKIIGLVVTKAR